MLPEFNMRTLCMRKTNCYFVKYLHVESVRYNNAMIKHIRQQYTRYRLLVYNIRKLQLNLDFSID